MKKTISDTLNTISHTSGIYLFKNGEGDVLYIGKAKDLHDRVKSYFLKQDSDWKIAGLLKEYVTIETIKTNTEIEALLLEAELIGQHKPKYNTLLKEGDPFVYIFISKDMVSDMTIVRVKKQKGLYFGPFLYKQDARNAVTFLKNTFRLNRCNKHIENGCLQYHIGTCAGTCRKDFDPDEYQFKMQLALDVLQGDMKNFIHSLQQKIKEYSAALAYEKARNMQKYIDNLEAIFATLKTKFSLEKYADQIISVLSPKKLVDTIPDNIAEELRLFLGVPKPIHTIDCFDISHFQSQEIVGSCVRFKDGYPDKNKFRRFMIQSLKQQNDYVALQEIVTRRYKTEEDLPDLILIDGGKGQLSAVQQVLTSVKIVSLAKKEERLFGENFPEGVHLDPHQPVGKMLIALRDYAHHFAVSYHQLRRRKSVVKK
ncbi:MAG TPA: GIY-YIG nuclease family protein [Patescibacteria group bacterium]|jgi:excinuclease ABC subunit C|nr:GIY-YIG nuclease family protein [Patescibacteria group bacterium]